MPKGCYPHRAGPTAKRIAIPCKVCGKERLYTQGQLAHRKKYGSGIKYCSIKCFGVAMTRRTTVTCPCGKTFSRMVGRKQRFCSRRCHYQASRKGPNGTIAWDDPAYRAAYLREYNRNNRVALNAKKAAYKRTHRPMANAIQRKRRAGGGSFSAAHWDAILALAPYCLACGSTARLQPDHVISLAEGGKNEPDNIQPLCFRCNPSKGKKHMDYRTAALKRRIKEVFAKDLRVRTK